MVITDHRYKNIGDIIVKYFNFITLLAFIMLVLTKNAYSYLDPGTGSYLIQILAAAIFGSLFAIKMFWGKIKEFFNTKSSGKNKNEKSE